MITVTVREGRTNPPGEGIYLEASYHGWIEPHEIRAMAFEMLSAANKVDPMNPAQSEAVAMLKSQQNLITALERDLASVKGPLSREGIVDHGGGPTLGKASKKAKAKK